MIVFLDIDGVLVTTPSWKPVALLDDGFMVFNTNASNNLQQILNKENCKVILTSTHRIRYDSKKWKMIFETRNIQIESLSLLNSISSISLMKSRQEEILEWLELNKTSESFIILDDDSSLQELPPAVKARWIKTDFLTGLTIAKTTEALALFQTS